MPEKIMDELRMSQHRGLQKIIQHNKEGVFYTLRERKIGCRSSVVGVNGTDYVRSCA